MTFNKKLLHSVVNHVATVNPERVAVIHGRRTCDYRTLVNAASRMELLLRRAGTRKGDIVALALKSSIEYLASMLGIMQAGAIFLPLDMSWPDRRLDSILNKTRPTIAITRGEQASAIHDRMSVLLGEKSTPTILAWNTKGDCQIHYSSEPYQNYVISDTVKVDPNDSCYIIYTSGSTGEPKAIIGRHKSLSHFMHWETQELGLDESVRVSQLAPTTFDASLRDFFAPLIVSGTVCIPTSTDRSTPGDLLEWIANSRISLLHTVPSLFRLIADELYKLDMPAARLPYLRYVCLAGEAIYGRDANRWRELLGDKTCLINFYGPSEATLIKSFYRLDSPIADPDTITPAGYPISNTAIVILRNGRLCDIGETGEIHIKTPFLTNGYYDDQVATAAAFIQNPLNEAKRDIIYKTGDLGRYRMDRCVEFIGRIDSQVKVNGVRIELADIERNAVSCEAIDQAVATVYKTRSGNNALACYFTERMPVSEGDVRSYLSERLPSYMLPTYFIKLDRFPLNVNGKVDRRLLLRPEAYLQSRGHYVPPDTRTEKVIAEIWQDVLELDKVSVESRFFDIGGHSLRATMVVSQVFLAFGVRLALKEVLGNSTVRELARLVDTHNEDVRNNIERVATADWYDVSHAQRRMWVLHQMDESACSYNLSFYVELEGIINTEDIRHVFEHLIARHECLRTRFREHDGILRQEVINQEDAIQQLDFSYINLSAFAGVDELARELAQREAYRPFDLGITPLVRIRLYGLAETRHTLVITVHHIIMDAWSGAVVAREFAAIYEAVTGDQPLRLPRLKYQYRDYAYWHNQQLASGALDHQLEYWREKLLGVPCPLALPYDFVRPAVSRHAGLVHEAFLSPEQRDILLHAAASYGVSTFMVLHTVCKIMLYRYTGEKDIVIGSPTAGRTCPEFEDQVGCFINTVPLFDHIESTDTFKSLLGKVQSTTIDAYENQEYPFALMVDELGIPADPSRQPLFEVMLVVQNSIFSASSISNLNIRDLRLDIMASRVDLTFLFHESSDRWHMALVYDSDLFLPETIAAMHIHFLNLLDSAITAPDTPIAELPMLTLDERDAVMTTFARGDDYPFEDTRVTALDLVARRAIENGNAVAVIDSEQQISYGELYDEACRCACVLVHDLGIRRGEVVATLTRRDTDWVVSILGIMLAGATYLPIDPELPDLRITHILNDSGCRAVIAAGSRISRARSLAGDWYVLDKTQWRRRDVDVELPIVAPSDLAYIIFTSGSTGDPKGVLLEHGGFANMVMDQIRTLGVRSEDRFLQFAACSFDASMYEIFISLLAGATVVVSAQALAQDPLSFVDYLNHFEVTVAVLPPVYLNALEQRELPTLRVLVTAGEPAIAKDVMFYAKRLNYFNAYGPTETSVCATVYPVPPNKRFEGNVPIGNPISNLTVYVLDEMLQPIPIGAIGEICIAGCGVARGYVNNHTQTVQRFFDDPWCTGQRLYRTGDLGRWRSDGLLEFCGRTDSQCKIRGYRVELGEVSAVMRKYPDIREAVVMAVGKPEVRLIACYTGAEVDRTVLHEHLANHLPSYMIPRQIVHLDTIPFTSRGKIDKDIVLGIIKTSISAQNELVAPMSRMERLLVEMWEEILDCEVIGINQSFFELGGTSIQAIRFIGSISNTIGYSVSIKTLILHPRIKDLARILVANLTAPKMDSDRVAVDGTNITVGCEITGTFLSEAIKKGELPPVSAAAIVVLPSELLGLSNIDRVTIKRDWCQNRVIARNIINTPVGRIACIALPFFADELFDKPSAVVEYIKNALALAQLMGARWVSLTGRLPAVTENARLLKSYLSDHKVPELTCGFAVTGAAMALSTEQLLSDYQSDWPSIVTIIGLSEPAIVALGVLFKNNPHPQEIHIYPIFEDTLRIAKARAMLVDELGFQGNIELLNAPINSIATKVQQAGLMIVCANATNLVPRQVLSTGMAVVLESGYGTDAIFESQNQPGSWRGMIVESDILRAPHRIEEIVYIPTQVRERLSRNIVTQLLTRKPSSITGCVLAGALCDRHEELGKTAGGAQLESGLVAYRLLVSLGYTANIRK